MIEIKKIESSEYKQVNPGSADYELSVDGEQLPKVNVSGSSRDFEELRFQIYTKDVYSGEKLLSQKLKDFPKIVYFSVPVKFELLDFETFITIYQEPDSSKLPEVSFYFEAKLLLWNQIYSFSEFEENLSAVIAENTDDKIEIKIYNSQEETKFVIGTHHDFGNLSLVEELTPFIEKSRHFYLKAKQKTVEGKSIKTITGYFDFPETLKVPCEQYLLYFAQFLQDLGINVTSNLKEEAGKVLFTITPTGDIEALDKIREALEVYLRLPSNQIVSNSQEIAIQRLESQVEYFRSQIRLAKAELQLKEATIQQQQVTIIKLGENVMIDSMVKNVTPAKNKSEFLGGSVEVMTPKFLENYGVKKIDLDKFWKYMKEKFAKK